MKCIFTTSIICLFSFINLYSQASEWNLDFEEWDLSNTTPDLWYDTIIENRVGLFPPKWFYRPDHIPEGTGLGRTTDATNGEYALTLSGYYQYEVMRIISGSSPEKPGWPINVKPDKLIGDYKAILLGNNCDSLRAYVEVFLTRYNLINKRRDTIGFGSIVLNETPNLYRQFELGVNYVDEFTSPDTVIIMIAKRRFGFDSPPACMECSHVYFDNLQFTNIVSTRNPISRKRKYEVFPNPATEDFVIKSDCKNCEFNITLISSNGQLVKEYSSVKSQRIIDTDDLIKGIYFIRIADALTQEYRYKKVLIH